MASQTNTRRNQNTGMYIDGNTVRKVQYHQAVPSGYPESTRDYGQKNERNQTRQTRNHSAAARTRARNRALQMSVGYVGFLSVAAVASLFICVSFLKLQAEVTAQRKEIAALTSSYSELKLKNDEAYSKAMSSVDLEEIRDIAINELGMVYANKGQIITYEKQDKDYVRQYEEVPRE